MKAIVTVVGKDRVGIIANVCTALANYNVNVLGKGTIDRISLKYLE